jgi:hypothetical protein
MGKRKKISEDVVADITSGSRRRCCICFALDKDDQEKAGQIAHLDHDPSNNAPDNLAFLCLRHHDDYDTRRSQSKGLTIQEAKRYRTELLAFLAQNLPAPDDAIVGALMNALDRPAFRTPFHQESSLPRFRDAIAETIDTLNTGQFRGRQISSKYQIRDHNLRSQVDQIVTALVGLRAAFDNLLRTKEIQHCGCGNDDCPTYTLTDSAAREMDRRRRNVLELAHGLHSNAPRDFYDLD